MTASEYQDRAQACLDLIVTTPRRQQFALLKIAEAWLQLADAALSREESDLGQNAPTTGLMQ